MCAKEFPPKQQQQQRMMENIVKDAWWWTSWWIDPQSAYRPGSLESFQQLQQSQRLQQQQKWLRTSQVDWAGERWTPEVKGSSQKRIEYPNSVWFLRWSRSTIGRMQTGCSTMSRTQLKSEASMIVTRRCDAAGLNASELFVSLFLMLLSV